MEKLINHFLIPLYMMIFENEPPLTSRMKMEAIREILDWFSSLNGTFLRVFSGEKLLHVFPRYSIDKLIMQEVSYHLTIGLSASLHKKKKAPWPTIPMKIGLYEMKNLKVVDIEGKAIEMFSFSTRDFNHMSPILFARTIVR